MRVVLVSVMLFAGCARPVPATTQQAYADLLVPAEQCRAPGPETVPSTALSEDVDVLERIFRRGYAGFERAGNEARWAETFAGLRTALPDSAIAPIAFRDLLLNHIGFVDDAHVGLWIYDPQRRWRSTTNHQQAWMAPAARFTRTDGEYADGEGRVLVGCDGVTAADLLRPVAGATLPAIVYAPVVISSDARTSLGCTFMDGSTQTLRLGRLDIGDGRGPAFERREAPFPWLRLRTLFTDHRSALEQFVATAEGLRGEPVIVLDLRRGGGGSDVFLLRWFRALTSQAIHYWRTDRLTSETTLQGALNFWGCVRAAVPTDGDPAGRAWLDARVARARRELTVAMNERGLFRDREPEARVLDGRATVPYRGRLLLVVDRGCGSACETSVLLARQLPGSLVVGENTEGAMKIGELRHYRLPHSRVWVSLGMRVHEDPDGRFQESRGFLPDIWLTGNDPDAQIRELAECLGDPECGPRLP